MKFQVGCTRLGHSFAIPQALLLGALLCGAGAAPVAAEPAGTFEFRRIQPPSLGGVKKDVRVYLPASYGLAEARDRRYPVIIFLHGWPGSEGNWPGRGHIGDTLDSMSASGSIPEIIAVFPDGGGVGLFGRSMWLNAAGERSNMEDFVAKDLVAWVDSSYRTRPHWRDRGVIGLSDGGTGAINLVLRHPDVFGAAGAHSADFRIRRDRSSGRIFGPDPEGQRLREEYSPLVYADRVLPVFADHTIYFDCGSSDEAIADNRAFAERLRELGVRFVFEEFPGTHEWGYWRVHVDESLLVVTAGMR